MFRFTEEEKQAIKNAVTEVEKETSGEIVPYFSEKSNTYLSTCWKSAVFFVLFESVILITLYQLWMIPGWFSAFEFSIMTLFSIFIGFAIPYFYFPARIALSGEQEIYNHVMSAAQGAFLTEKVYNTKEKTGILIYISYSEKQVLVLGDSGINAKVKPEDWEHIVKLVVNGIKQNQAANGIIEAIHECKNLLLQHGFVIKPNDSNELSNELRIDES